MTHSSNKFLNVFPKPGTIEINECDQGARLPDCNYKTRLDLFLTYSTQLPFVVNQNKVGRHNQTEAQSFTSFDGSLGALLSSAGVQIKRARSRLLLTITG